jgi:hypothetical protein
MYGMSVLFYNDTFPFTILNSSLKQLVRGIASNNSRSKPQHDFKREFSICKSENVVNPLGPCTCPCSRGDMGVLRRCTIRRTRDILYFMNGLDFKRLECMCNTVYVYMYMLLFLYEMYNVIWSL